MPLLKMATFNGFYKSTKRPRSRIFRAKQSHFQNGKDQHGRSQLSSFKTKKKWFSFALINSDVEESPRATAENKTDDRRGSHPLLLFFCLFPPLARCDFNKSARVVRRTLSLRIPVVSRGSLHVCKSLALLQVTVIAGGLIAFRREPNDPDWNWILSPIFLSIFDR